MTIKKHVPVTILFGLAMLLVGCVMRVPSEGYYDRDHHRYWHDHGWRECGERDEHCR